MSIFGSLIAGVSGIRAQAQGLATISDNIANVNTIGYKRLETRFSTLVTAASPATHSPGGVRSKPIQLVDQSGLLLGSTFETDLAIDGKGLFSVANVQQKQPGDEFYFTRNGSFRPDKDGYLKNDAGFYLQAWELDATGNLPTGSSELISLQSVNVSNITGNPTPTSDLFMGATLSASAAAGTEIVSTVTVYDSLGTDHTLRLSWVKGAAANVWGLKVRLGDTSLPASIGGNTLDEDLSATGFDVGTNLTAATAGLAGQEFLRVTFNSDGSLADIESMDAVGTPSVIDAAGNFTVALDFTSVGANLQSVNFNFGTPAETDGVVQFDVAVSDPVRTFDQNGVAFGTATGVSIDNEGFITALFDNGEQKRIYKIPLVDFSNPNALQARTGNAYRQTANSGAFTLREAGTGGIGRIIPFSLEGSTVDIADEFANMIVTQRAYSANTRVISTADDMLEELIRSTQ